VGILSVYSQTPDRFNNADARRLEAFTHLAAVAIQKTRYLNETLRLATIDTLTGLNNRRFFIELAQRDIDRAVRYKTATSVIMFDIDNFKLVNDRYGHSVGDEVLAEFGRRCLLCFRRTDLIGRFGGEEFIILLPETSLDITRQVADRFRVLISNKPFETSGGPLSVTISLGVTGQTAGQSCSVDSLLTRVDQALSSAKKAGRNQVCTEAIPDTQIEEQP
jgi:diguanylate cyclase (GGDEF)-like protein